MNGNEDVRTEERHAPPEEFLSPLAGKGSPVERVDVPPNSMGRMNPLGEPLAIEEVARLLGCSPWTVRQRYLRQGLPYLQARPRGKLVFFCAQVIAWIEKRQRQKGGLPR